MTSFAFAIGRAPQGQCGLRSRMLRTMPLHPPVKFKIDARPKRPDVKVETDGELAKARHWRPFLAPREASP